MKDVTKQLGSLNTGLDGRDFLLGEVSPFLGANIYHQRKADFRRQDRVCFDPSPSQTTYAITSLWEVMMPLATGQGTTSFSSERLTEGVQPAGVHACRHACAQRRQLDADGRRRHGAARQRRGMGQALRRATRNEEVGGIAVVAVSQNAADA